MYFLWHGNMDVESGGSNMDKTAVEMDITSHDEIKGSTSKAAREDDRKYANSKEAIGNKYAAFREQSRQSNMRPTEKHITAAKVSLLDESKPQTSTASGGRSSGLVTKWESMKNGFQSFKANVGAKRFFPLRQIQETTMSRESSSESLDEIFQRLKRPSVEPSSFDDDEGDLGSGSPR